MNFLKTIFLPITTPIKFIQNNFKATLFITLIVFLFSNSNKTTLKPANLQIINLSGTIMDASSILENINKAKEDYNIKGVLLNVNSGGGAVAPSIEIAYAIKELNKIKPVIAYASGTMASGSYYASIWAHKILSNPGSIIGSIGVIMQSADTSELLNKIGIKPQTIKIGKYKEVGTPTRAWNKQERDELNKVIQDTYNMFVYDVANARGLKVSNHTIYADAHIFTANQAKKVGLIDEVVTINQAKLILQKDSNVTNAIWNKKDKIDVFMEKFISKTINKLPLTTSLQLMSY
jgi:protease-4